MNSEEIAQLELRLTKVMAVMEARLTNAIHQVRPDLSARPLLSPPSRLHWNPGLSPGNQIRQNFLSLRSVVG